MRKRSQLEKAVTGNRRVSYGTPLPWTPLIRNFCNRIIYKLRINSLPSNGYWNVNAVRMWVSQRRNEEGRDDEWRWGCYYIDWNICSRLYRNCLQLDHKQSHIFRLSYCHSMPNGSLSAILIIHHSLSLSFSLSLTFSLCPSSSPILSPIICSSCTKIAFTCHFNRIFVAVLACKRCLLLLSLSLSLCFTPFLHFLFLFLSVYALFVWCWTTTMALPILWMVFSFRPRLLSFLGPFVRLQPIAVLATQHSHMEPHLNWIVKLNASAR